MDSSWRFVPELTYVVLAVWLQWVLARRLLAFPFFQRSARARHALHAAWVASFWLAAGIVYAAGFYYGPLPPQGWLQWMRGLAFAWGLTTGGILLLLLPWRRLMRVAWTTMLAAPVAAAGGGVFIERFSFRVREVHIQIPGLAPDLDGLRLAQLSDIHFGPFLEEKHLRRVVAMANETRPDLILVTGDLITLRPSRLSACLRILKGLRATAGVLGCLGNHEILARCQEQAKAEGARMGIDFLRNQNRQLRFGQATLNIAGVDHQRRNRPYLVGTHRLLRSGAMNLLLSHNPDVFPVAAAQGWDLTLAGHTHGGQVTVGILNQHLNIARFLTRYVYGLYRKPGSAIYVTSGIGTVRVPVRVGAPPEVALIRLCAT